MVGRFIIAASRHNYTPMGIELSREIFLSMFSETYADDRSFAWLSDAGEGPLGGSQSGPRWLVPATGHLR